MGVIENKAGADTIDISLEHYKVHDGAMFHCGYYTKDLTGSSYIELLLKTGSGEPHLKASVEAGGAAKFTLFEAGTMTADGTSQSVFNMKRESSNTCTAGLFLTPTIDTTGTAIDTLYIAGATAQPVRIGGSTRQGTEWYLNANSNYLISVQNLTASTITSNINLEFYEV